MSNKIENILINIWFNYSFGLHFQKYQIDHLVFLVSIGSRFFCRNLTFLNEIEINKRPKE